MKLLLYLFDCIQHMEESFTQIIQHFESYEENFGIHFCIIVYFHNLISM